MDKGNKDRPEFDPDYPHGGIIPHDQVRLFFSNDDSPYDVYDLCIHHQNMKLCRGQ